MKARNNRRKIDKKDTKTDSIHFGMLLCFTKWSCCDWVAVAVIASLFERKGLLTRLLYATFLICNRSKWDTSRNKFLSDISLYKIRNNAIPCYQGRRCVTMTKRSGLIQFNAFVEVFVRCSLLVGLEKLCSIISDNAVE